MGNLPIGQGESVTPMQIAQFYGAIANGGILKTPHLVRRIDGKLVPAHEGRRVMKASTAAALRDMLEGVLAPGGTAAEVKIPGYQLAGKTGTANKIDPTTHEYSQSAYVASFVGFAPAKDPKLLICVMVDEPHGAIYGGAGRRAGVRQDRQLRAALREDPADGRRDEVARRPAPLWSPRCSWGDLFEDRALPDVDVTALPTTRAPSRRAPSSSACAASRPTATATRPTPWPTARSRSSSTTRWTSRSRGPRGRRARRHGPGRRALQRRPDGRAGDGRHHRHQRQDHHLVPDPRAAGGQRAPDRPDRHRDVVGRRASSTRSCARRRRRSTCSGCSRAMRDGGDAAVVMEVSSHALALGRADAIHWDVAAFTNLTQDHLDFHADMEDYFLAKRRAVRGGGRAGRDADRQRRRRLRRAAGRRTSRRRSTIGIDAPDATLRADRPRRRARRRRDFTRRRARASPRRCPGASTSSTRSCAIAAARALGVDDATIAAALPGAGGVPGRFEPVDAGQDFAVIVDYAHKPDALDNVLRTARELAGGAA